MQSNKTARFRFSIKYLNLKVVLQIVCLVPVLLAPKLILYKTKRYWLSTNFKYPAFSSPPSIQYWFVMMQCFENQGVVCQITRSQTIIRQLPYTKESKARTLPDDRVQHNHEMAVVKCKYYEKDPKHCNPLAFHSQDLFGNIPQCHCFER